MLHSTRICASRPETAVFQWRRQPGITTGRQSRVPLPRPDNSQSFRHRWTGVLDATVFPATPLASFHSEPHAICHHLDRPNLSDPDHPGALPASGSGSRLLIPGRPLPGNVRLPEVHAGSAVAQAFEPCPSAGLGVQGLADRVVAPALTRRDLGEPLPGLPHAPGKQVARNAEVTVTNESLAGRVARVQNFDPHVPRPDHLPLLLGRPEHCPHFLGRGVDLEREAVILHVSKTIMTADWRRSRARVPALIRRRYPAV